MRNILIIDSNDKRASAFREELEKILSTLIPSKLIIQDKREIVDKKYKHLLKKDFLIIERKHKNYLPDLRDTILTIVHCTETSQIHGERFSEYCIDKGVPVLKIHGEAREAQGKPEMWYRYPAALDKDNVKEVNFKNFFTKWRKIGFNPKKVKDYWLYLLPEKETPNFFEFASLDILIQGLLTIVGLNEGKPWEWMGDKEKDFPNLSPPTENPEFQKQLKIIKNRPCRWFLECWEDLKRLFPDMDSNEIINQRIDEISDDGKKFDIKNHILFPSGKECELLCVAKAVLICKEACEREKSNPEEECPEGKDFEACTFCPQDAIDTLTKKEEGKWINLIKAHNQYAQIYNQ